MSVIARLLGARSFTVFCKGAPEKIISFCSPNSVPLNITSVLGSYTSNGFRVIALAYKTLPRKFNYKQTQRASREEVEKDLEFLGLLLMQNTLKPESAPVIKELKMAGIKCAMVTGDNLLTAVSVSRDCGLLNTKVPIAVVNVDLSYPSPRILLQKMSTIPGTVDMRDSSIPLVIDGHNWSLLQKHFPNVVPKIACRILIFARMSSDHKREVVEAFQSADYIVSMVGDGANDCSALKSANVGISLSQAEASIAAPFTSREPNIICVLELIKEGRSALVTSFSLFKYMACYSIVQFLSVLLLYQRGVELSNMEFLYVDLVITTSLAVVMGRVGPAEHLNKHRPLTSLVAVANVVPLIMHIIAVAFFQKLCLFMLSTMDWYIPVDPNQNGGSTVQSYENTALFMTSCFQYFILASVFNKGKPHRQPLHKHWMFVGLVTLLCLFSVFLTIHPSDWLAEEFELMPAKPVDVTFRLLLLILPILHLITAIFIENCVPNSRLLKWIVQKITRKQRPKNLYKIYEKDYDIPLTYDI
uniref:Cation-transporting P-type ATPase C-terminal domain-containing protein n=2 Tax=Clastoptera arizonana TaxID=38151 RepID=A0A1B6E5I1_9HEMI